MAGIRKAGHRTEGQPIAGMWSPDHLSRQSILRRGLRAAGACAARAVTCGGGGLDTAAVGEGPCAVGAAAKGLAAVAGESTAGAAITGVIATGSVTTGAVTRAGGEGAASLGSIVPESGTGSGIWTCGRTTVGVACATSSALSALGLCGDSREIAPGSAGSVPMVTETS